MVGALLVSRDGFCLINKCPRLSRPETFSAMTAVLVGSAETAMLELGQKAALRTISEEGNTRVVAAAVNEELLIVAISETSLPLQNVVTAVEDCSNAVAKIVAGG